MKENPQEMRQIFKKLREFFKDQPFLITIGDVSEITGVPQTKIRYWDKCGYIDSVQGSPNQSRKYTFDTMIQVQIISTYLNEGFTLKVAATKACHYKEYQFLLKQVFKQKFYNIHEFNDQASINLGPLDNDSQHEVFLTLKDGKVKTFIEPIESKD